MRDYLFEFCDRQKIQLIYTNNKFSILSIGIKDNIPVIRINRIFKNCSLEIANTIINYYNYFLKQQNCIAKIKNFVIQNNPLYKLNPIAVINNYLQIKPLNSDSKKSKKDTVKDKDSKDKEYITVEYSSKLHSAWKDGKKEKLGLKEIYKKLNENRYFKIKMERDNLAVICGVVRFENGKPVKDALVKLFKKNFDRNMKSYELIPITFTFTDEYGCFLFGAEAEVDLVIQVFYYEPSHKICTIDFYGD